jgi:sugar O-acyltransferase (sialic acid O-acetyltransferase NeuD family)
MLLVGAGGHAKAVVECLAAADSAPTAYVDPQTRAWLRAKHYADDDEVGAGANRYFVLGLGGITPQALRRRLELFDRYVARGWRPAPAIHASAEVSGDAVLADGVVVLRRAVVQPGARIGRAAIVNTGAIVEHDAEIGAGAHIAPGAVILGDCRIGVAAMIGAGAVVLPSTQVPDETLVAALTRFPQ